MAQFPFTQAEYERLHHALFQAYLEALSSASLFARQGFTELAEHSYKQSEELLSLADLVHLKMRAESQAAECVWYTAEEWYNVLKANYDACNNVKREAV